MVYGANVSLNGVVIFDFLRRKRIFLGYYMFMKYVSKVIHIDQYFCIFFIVDRGLLDTIRMQSGCNEYALKMVPAFFHIDKHFVEQLFVL